MELITIIIPTRDRLEFLENCLRSVYVGQKTVPKVIVSDNSVSTHPEIEGLGNKYGFMYVRQSGAFGETEHMNSCLEMASTPWVMLLHDDDELYSDSLETLEPLLAKFIDAGIVIGGIQVIDGQGRVGKEWLPEIEGLFTGEDGLLRLGLNWEARPPGIIYNVDAARRAGGFVEVDGAADYALAVQLAYSQGVIYSPSLLGRYRCGHQQMTDFTTPEKAEAYLEFSIGNAKLVGNLGCSIDATERIFDYLTWWTFLTMVPNFIGSHPSFVVGLTQKCLRISHWGGEWQMRAQRKYPLLFWQPHWLAGLFFPLVNKTRYMLERLAQRLKRFV